MKTVLAMSLLLAACATGPRPRTVGPSERFIPTQEHLRTEPRAGRAKMLVDDDEIAAEAPFKLVGVVEVEGKETEPLKSFLSRAEAAGATAGCDVLVHRDAFELGTWTPRLINPRGVTRGSMGRDWQRSDQVVWQFLCGVRGATDDEEAQTMRQATLLAINLRWKELGGYEPCEQYTPTGSHVRKTHVCANDPGHHSEADGRSSAPSH